MTGREKLQEFSIDDSEIVLLDEDLYVESLVGVVMLPGIRAVYNYDIMCKEYAERYDCTYDEAMDYISYDVIRWCEAMGETAPIIFDPLEY